MRTLRYEIRISKTSVSQQLSTPPLTCNEACCVSPKEKPFHPSTKDSDFNARSKGRTFQETWYNHFAWMTVCTTRTESFLLQLQRGFSKKADVAFTKSSSRNNWKKSLEKFSNHERSEAKKAAAPKPLDGPGLLKQNTPLRLFAKVGSSDKGPHKRRRKFKTALVTSYGLKTSAEQNWQFEVENVLLLTNTDVCITRPRLNGLITESNTERIP